MYPSPYSAHPYTGRSPLADARCPICGADGDCPDATPVDMPLPPFALAETIDESRGGPLRRYAVTVNGYQTEMQLTDDDAARLGTAAVPIP